ncbi:transposase (plasmid) [Streptomyces scopuliridis]|uniref:Transposase n=1 Tax=Streptomyces scopuliridis TaxID=452529 RepID=A0ACD4ZZ06_9ACTN|nr:transposase [Streptomyces scopuliridis]WSC03571.1 transposase [Streptomyces scopuliridis]WSC11420.1 transposase [Streptomyces scopuliridis]
MLAPGAVRTGELSEAEIRSLEGELEALCASVDDVFARPASGESAGDGARAAQRGAAQESVAARGVRRASDPDPDRLQGFLAKAPWNGDELRDRVRAYAVAALAADDAVLITNETGDIRKGTKTAGGARAGARRCLNPTRLPEIADHLKMKSQRRVFTSL